MRDWNQQLLGMLAALMRGTWLVLWIAGSLTGWLHPSWTWYVFPLFFACVDFLNSLRIPGHDWKDVLMAAVLLPNELFAWLRAGWFIASWYKVLFVNDQKDLWASQYAAEQ